MRAACFTRSRTARPSCGRWTYTGALSPGMTLVKVRLQLFGSVMADYLNLMKIDGQWWIVAKHFRRVDDAAA